MPGGLEPKRMTATGEASISPRKQSIFPRVLGLESRRRWQRTFFYMKSTGPQDLVNLPMFSLPPPTEQHNWDFNPRELDIEVNSVQSVLERYVAEKKLTPDDLLRTFVSRRVCPLQTRVHKICHMSGHFDPTRVSTCLLSKEQVKIRVKAIARSSMPAKWTWGVEPYDRDNLPPNVSVFSSLRRLLIRGAFHVRVSLPCSNL